MSKIEEFFEKAVAAGIIPQIPMNYDAVSYKIYAGYLENKIDELTAEVAELRATLSKTETVEKELRERLNKAVKLPYERKRLLWGDKDKETLLCPDCLTDIMGGIGDETFVVQCPNCGCFVNSAIEPIEFTANTEARLKEIKERK